MGLFGKKEKKPETTPIASQTEQGIVINDTTSMKVLVDTIALLKRAIIDRVGQDFYEAKLNTFDPDLAEALTEADHQFMRAETAQAELEYYKACNDPNGFHGPQLKEMHDRLNAYKQQLENFEKSQTRQQQQPVQMTQPMTSLAQGLHNNPEDELEDTPAHPYNYLEQAIEKHERPDISMSAPMTGTLPSLPINFDQ